MREDRDIEIERRKKHSDSSRVASTFIKYTAYIIITIIILYFLAKYILPMF